LTIGQNKGGPQVHNPKVAGSNPPLIRTCLPLPVSVMLRCSPGKIPCSDRQGIEPKTRRIAGVCASQLRDVRAGSRRLPCIFPGFREKPRPTETGSAPDCLHRQHALCGQSLRPLIGPEKPSNSAVFRGYLCTLERRQRLGITLQRPAFSAAVHLAHSVPTRLFLVVASICLTCAQRRVRI
jgi:hypothetical protein